MTGTRRTIFFLAGAAPLTASLLGGCYYSERTVSERVVPSAPVVVTAPSPAVTVATPTARVVSYPEGRFQLYGDAATGYYWVWIPSGNSAPAPPAPPPLPGVSQGTSAAISPVAVAPARTVITYPDGRYQLYGDAATGYYWVWIPSGVALQYPPPPLPRFTQGP
jgi:hypothetical protein